jgi:hypothetical protein
MEALTQDAVGGWKPSESPREESKSFFTPYAPAVLTLRGPSTAIPLG